MRGKPLTISETFAAALVTLLAAVIAVSYVWARIGRVSPFAMLGFAIATAIVLGVALFRRASWNTGSLLAFTGIGAALWGWLLWLTQPDFLPPAGRGDLAHHLMLVDYIERHWQLPDASLVAVMAEMAHYTPGLHLLAALAGAWSGTDGLRAIYPVIAFTVALKAGLVFLIAWRVLPDHTPRIPIGLAAVVLLLLPQQYFLGALFQESFLAQVAAELFAVAMWWALVVWDREPTSGATALSLFAAAGVGAFLTWPIWIGPPVVALIAIVLTREEMTYNARVKQLAVAIVPIAAIALVHAAGRTGWFGIAGTTGAVLRPSVQAFGWPFLILAVAGLLLALRQRRARATLLLTLSIGAQGMTLYLLAQSQSASAPYMALKMVYLLLYPFAVLGALAVGTPLGRIPRRHAVAWALLLVTVVTFRKALIAAPRPAPVVSLDLYEAGRWARGQLEAACVDYLVPHPDTMYWLHLAVLGNPRASLRTADPDTFDPQRAIARWIQPGGLPYGIVDLRTLPRDVLADVDILEQFRTAAVIRRRGPSFCPDAQRLAFTP